MGEYKRGACKKSLWVKIKKIVRIVGWMDFQGDAVFIHLLGGGKQDTFQYILKSLISILLPHMYVCKKRGV